MADYVTLNVHMNGVPETVLSAYSGHLYVVTVGNGIFPAKFLDKICYSIMANRKKCRHPVTIPHFSESSDKDSEFEAHIKSKVAKVLSTFEYKFKGLSQRTNILFNSNSETGAHAILC